MPANSTTFYVYILARPNGKPFYVGKGTNDRILAHEQEAKRGHKCHKCNVIRKIWKMGGVVQRYTVFTTPDEAEAYAYEIELIALYGLDTLANATHGGKGGSKGGTHSAEARAKISAAKIAYFSQAENRARQASFVAERWADPDARAQRIATLKAAQNTIEAREKRDAALKTQWSDPAARARKSAQSKAMWADPEFRARMRVANKAAQTTPERRAQQTARNNAMWADPEYRERMSTRLARQASAASKIGHAKAGHRAVNPRKKKTS
jgi:hypothetical protein